MCVLTIAFFILLAFCMRLRLPLQLRQIIEAMYIARILDRALVMPKVFCQYDIFWDMNYFEDGRITMADGPPPGPFHCPLDNVFDLISLMRFFDVREHSFLENPRLPKEVMETAVTLAPPSDPWLNADELHSALKEQYNSTSLLHFAGRIDEYWFGNKYLSSNALGEKALDPEIQHKEKEGRLPLTVTGR